VPVQPDPARCEKFAQGVADGLCLRHAATAAGYSHHSTCIYKAARGPAFRARVEALVRERQWGRTNELGSIIARIVDCADKALAQGAVLAARQCLADAAKLKASLPRPLAPGEESESQWTSAHGPVD
jgi:hypothetical protein